MLKTTKYVVFLTILTDFVFDYKVFLLYLLFRTKMWYLVVTIITKEGTF